MSDVDDVNFKERFRRIMSDEKWKHVILYGETQCSYIIINKAFTNSRNKKLLRSVCYPPVKMLYSSILNGNIFKYIKYPRMTAISLSLTEIKFGTWLEMSIMYFISKYLQDAMTNKKSLLNRVDFISALIDTILNETFEVDQRLIESIIQFDNE